MPWYAWIIFTVLLILVLYLIFAPWLSIMDISKSIDRLRDEVRESNVIMNDLKHILVECMREEHGKES